MHQLRHRLAVARGEQPSAVLADFGDRHRSSRDHGRAESHRLDRRQAKAFFRRRIEQRSGALDQRLHVFVVEPFDPANAIADAELFDLLLGAVRPVPHLAASAHDRDRVVEPRERAEHRVVPLVRIVLADGEEVALRHREPRATRLRIFGGQRRAQRRLDRERRKVTTRRIAADVIGDFLHHRSAVHEQAIRVAAEPRDKRRVPLPAVVVGVVLRVTLEDRVVHLHHRRLRDQRQPEVARIAVGEPGQVVDVGRVLADQLAQDVLGAVHEDRLRSLREALGQLRPVHHHDAQPRDRRMRSQLAKQVALNTFQAGQGPMEQTCIEQDVHAFTSNAGAGIGRSRYRPDAGGVRTEVRRNCPGAAGLAQLRSGSLPMTCRSKRPTRRWQQRIENAAQSG